MFTLTLTYITFIKRFSIQNIYRILCHFIMFQHLDWHSITVQSNKT